MSGEFAGRLDQSLSLQRRDAARDDLGAPADRWRDLGALWACLEPRPPAPWGEGDRPAARPRWRATVRSAAMVRPGDRVQWRGGLLAVRAVTADPAAADRLLLDLEQMP